MIIKLKSGKYARVRIKSVHDSKTEAEWAEHAPRMLQEFKQRTQYRAAAMDETLEGQWKRKCNTWAVSCGKRTVSDRYRRRPKTSDTWYKSCRTMLSQWYKRKERHDQSGWWKWSVSCASNNRKRMRAKREKADSEVALPAG